MVVRPWVGGAVLAMSLYVWVYVAKGAGAGGCMIASSSFARFLGFASVGL